MAISNAVSLANFSSKDILIVDSTNDRVGIASTTPTQALDVVGTIKATSGTFTGNVSVGGTLSYEDVTNIDSVGIITARSGVKVPDNQKIFLGTGDDLEIYHDGSNSKIVDSGAGQLILQTNAFRVLNAVGNENMIDGDENGDVKLYYDGSEKLKTASAGVNVTGNLDLQDNGKILLGTGDDLEIYHDGSDSYIKDTGTGDLKIFTSNFDVRNAAGTENLIDAQENGAVKLFYDNSQKLITKSDGVDITGELQCDSLDVDGTSDYAGDLTVRGGAGAITVAGNSDIRLNTGNWTGDAGGKIQNHNNNMYIQYTTLCILRASNGDNRFEIDASGNVNIDGTFTSIGTISDSSGNLRITPISAKSGNYTLVATDTGKTITRTGGNITVPQSMTAGMIVTIINNASSTVSIIQGSGATLRFTDSSTGTKTLAAYGVATVTYISASSAYITGTGLS